MPALPTCVSGPTCCQPGADSSSHRLFELHAQPMRDDRDSDGPAGFRKQLTEQVRREPSASGHKRSDDLVSGIVENGTPIERQSSPRRR